MSVRTPGHVYSPAVEYTLELAVSELRHFVDQDWIDLALACLDQAGLSVADQERVRKLLIEVRS